MIFSALPFISLPNILIGLVNILIGFLVLSKNPKGLMRVLFFAFCLSVSLWNIFIGIMGSGISSEVMSFAFKASGWAGSFIPYFILLFSAIFPKEKMKFSLGLILLLTIPALVMVSLSWTNLLLENTIIRENVITMKLGVLALPYLFYFVFYFTWTLYNLLSTMRRSQNFWERQQCGYFLLGLFLTSTIGIFCNIILVYFNKGNYVYLGPTGTIFLVGFTAFAITKHRLMDIRVVINRVTAWILTVIFLGGIYVGLVLLYQTYVNVHGDMLYTNTFFLIWTIIYGILVGELFQRIRIFIQTSADKLFLKGKYEFRKEAPDIAEKLASVINLKDFSEAIEHIRLENIETSSIDVLLPENFGGIGGQEDTFLLWDLKTTTPKSNGIKLEKKTPLIQQLLKEKKLISKSEIPHKIIGTLEKHPFEICVPCFLRGKLAAILLIGKKLSEDPYNDEELDILRILAPQFAVLIERIKPFEQVTKRYQKTKKVAEQAIQQAQYGALIQRIRHEFNNPLAMMLTRTELLMKSPGDPESIKKFGEMVIRNIKRLKDLTEAMRRVGDTNKTKETSSANINNILKDIILVGGATFEGKGINVIENYGNIPSINASEAEIYQVFMNLTLNASDAIQAKGGGDLTLTTKPIKIQKSDGIMVDGVEIQVKDTGCGISQENIDKLFDPFFTTKEKGSGLGLSRTAEIINEYGGTIEVETEIDQGTTFIVRLPRE